MTPKCHARRSFYTPLPVDLPTISYIRTGLIEDRSHWFKTEVGLGIRETPLNASICEHVVLQPRLTNLIDGLKAAAGNIRFSTALSLTH